VDQFQEPRNKGILHEISVNDPFYDITTETIALRVRANMEEFKIKVEKKIVGEKVYSASKVYHEEKWEYYI